MLKESRASETYKFAFLQCFPGTSTNRKVHFLLFSFRVSDLRSCGRNILIDDPQVVTHRRYCGTDGRADSTRVLRCHARFYFESMLQPPSIPVPRCCIKFFYLDSVAPKRMLRMEASLASTWVLSSSYHIKPHSVNHPSTQHISKSNIYNQPESSFFRVIHHEAKQSSNS